MDVHHQNAANGILSPQRVKEKADILETNLFKAISKQTDPARMQVKINRAAFPDAVICKAIQQLTPRFNIPPQEFLLELRELLQKEIPPDKQEKFEKTLNNSEGTLYDDLNSITRHFEAIASDKELEIIVKGIPEIKSIDGEIAKSFFNHEQSPGKLSRDGVINFKEINKFPVVNSGDVLFYITHEKQGKQGLSYDGHVIPVNDAKPYMIDIGPQVKKIDDPDDTGKSRGYFLQARSTGVVILDRDEHGTVTGIDISEEVDVKKLDYSTGNIGSQYTCPIRMKIGVICNGFKLRVNGNVVVTIVDGGEIMTDSEAIITKTQPGSVVTALKDIRIDSATRSKIISEGGMVSFNRELIESEVSSPTVRFEKSKGLITNNIIETENLVLTGLFFSGENIIHFGTRLFAEKKALMSSREALKAEQLELINTEKVLMGKLQLELKRMAKLTLADHDLVKHIKPIILATQTMDYETIFKEMDLVQKRNNTKVVAHVRHLFESLEKIPQNMKACEYKASTLNQKMNSINRRMAGLHLSIEGFLRRAATIKVFCGSIEEEKAGEPDFKLVSNASDNQLIKVTGTYSPDRGFEFAQ